MAVVSGGTTLIDNGALDSAITSGNLILLSTQTASASATIDFTSGIDSTYDSYVFRFYNIHLVTDGAEFEFQADTGTNTNYNQTITSTYFLAEHNEADTSASLSYQTGRDLAQSTNDQQLFPGLGGASATDESGSGYLQIFNPSSDTFVKHYIARGNSINQSGNYCWSPLIAGYGNTTSAINAVKFQMSSGNIDAGDICLYGIA